MQLPFSHDPSRITERLQKRHRQRKNIELIPEVQSHSSRLLIVVVHLFHEIQSASLNQDVKEDGQTYVVIWQTIGLPA